MYLFLYFLFFVVLSDVVFRFLYKKKYGKSYCVFKKIKWNRNHVVANPFLTFSYKKKETIDTNQLLQYKLHPNEYFSFKNPLKINNMGHFGNDFETEKPNNIIRIACLGNSNTANNIADKNRDYSYPSILEECLSKKINNKKVEVYNFGIGGWVSIDIMIDFFLNVIRTKPDYLILCNGFTDLNCHLKENFQYDYSHARCNLGEKIHFIRLASLLPRIPFFFLYEYLKTNIFGTGNVRNDVIGVISKGKIDTNLDYKYISVEKNIIKNILIVCKHYKIKVIICSYPFYNYDKTVLSNKIEEGIVAENLIGKELSEEFKCSFIDQNSIIPKTNDYFLDWVHMTPNGMIEFAKNISNIIFEDLIKKYQNVIYIDIDDTISIMPEDKLDYTKAMPNFDNIKKANKLYDDGNIIIYWTARGRKSGIDYRKITENQLKEWNVKYHELKLDKPYDLIIDDRSLHPREWK